MIETSRLILRPWMKADLPEFIRVTNTPLGMRYLGGLQAGPRLEAAQRRERQRSSGASRAGRFRARAVTVAANTASWGLMERLGMHRRRDLDFEHPNFAEGHPLRRHITYVAERPGRAKP